jgi:hypothetical protein
MLSIGSWRWHIDIIITILDIIHRPVFYLKHNVSDTGLCLRLQVEHTQLSQIDGISLCCPEIGTSSIYSAQLSKLHLKMETESSLRNVVLQIKDRTMDTAQNSLYKVHESKSHVSSYR